MRDAGLVDVQSRSYRTPSGPWSLKDHPEHQVMVEYLMRWWKLICRVLTDSALAEKGTQYRIELIVQMEESYETAQASRGLTKS